ncbi:MAG: DUF305 domain-containing protein [Gemmatimonas sp.]|nr:DUF305 domain-containing protein [Gemmatimonas sp.]
MSHLLRSFVLAVMIALGTVACGAARTGPSVSTSTWAPTEADVDFMRGMIHHHEQALEMTALVRERTSTEAIPLLAQRIELSQVDEIAFIQRWLEDHGLEGHGEQQPVSVGVQPMMPGMLTESELAELDAASGIAFDVLFLESMIRHHQGALVMVDRLLDSPGAAENADIYQFAAHVDSDQRLEIARMGRMLATMH